MSLPQINFTPVPHIIFDKWMPLLSPGEFKVLLCIVRKTYGWHKSEDKISLNQIVKNTTLSRQGVINSINKLMGYDLVIKVKTKTDLGDDDVNSYRINIEDDGGGSQLSRLGVVNSVDQGVVNSVDPQKISNTKDKEYTGKKNSPEKISSAVKETQKEFQAYLNEVLPGRKPMGDSAVKKYLQPLVNRHKKDPDRIKRVLKWIFKSQSPKADFWLPVIQGPKSLYTNFDQIEVQMNRKTEKEKAQEQHDAREELIENNRKWCKQNIVSITFPNTQKCMRLEDNCVRVKIGNSIESISLAEKNLKDIVSNKLRGWGFFI